MQATITFKWNAWAKRTLWVELGMYLTWLVAFQIFVLLFQASSAPCLMPCIPQLWCTCMCLKHV